MVVLQRHHSLTDLQIINRYMKRLLSLAIIASLAMSYTAPVLAIEDSVKTDKIKNEKITPTKNKHEYINMAWWQGFNDELLNGYIINALENNKDLKMATLTIDEFYQNVVAQRSAQLPQVQAGKAVFLRHIPQGFMGILQRQNSRRVHYPPCGRKRT